MKQTEAQRSMSYKKREAKAKFLALVADGVPSLKACEAIGRKPGTYYDWREEDRDWANRVDAARLGAGDPLLPGMDFVKFRNVFFDRSTPAHHLQMIQAMESAEPDSVTLILAFPESAKTSLLTDRVCYKVAYDPNWRHAIISEGQDLARKIVAHVAMRMTDEAQFRPFITKFGPFKAPDRELAKPWNADFFTHMQSHHDEKEPTVEARGAGSALYGGRYEEIDLDDIQSDKNLNATAQLLRYFRQTVLTRPVKGKGRTGIWGSRVGPTDFYHQAIEEDIVDKVVCIPALTEWVDRDDHFVTVKSKVVLNPELPETMSAWPEYWSMLDLAKRRKKVGEEVWARTYMQRSLYEAGGAFSPEMIEEAKDHDRGVGRGAFGVGTMMSVDPAFETGVCAFMAAAWSTEKLWLLDSMQRTDMFSTEDILAQIAVWAALYRPSVLIVENNNFQKGLARDERLAAMARKFGFEVISHHTNRQKNDAIIGVAMMASAFRDKEIRIPWGDTEAQDHFRALTAQLASWRPKRSKDITQDAVMTLWFLWLRWELVRQQPSGNVTRLWRPTFMAS